MRRLSGIIFCLLLSLIASAQTQQGFVKTIGRPGKPGIPLGNVTIQLVGMVNPIISSASGEFHLSAYNKKDGDAIKLLRVLKNGYELKDRELIGRPLVFSSRVPIEILMVEINQLEMDKKRIEDNAYRMAENNYQKKLKEIERQKKENAITAEKYRLELRALQNKYEKYLSLVSEMADRYARTDYDQLDSIDREINICIENGELDKADSLIHTVFDPETVLERNRAAKAEIQQRIAFAQSIIDKAKTDRESIMKDLEYATRVIVLCENLSHEYVAHGELSLAIGCLKKAHEIACIQYGEENDKAKNILKRINELGQ